MNDQPRILIVDDDEGTRKTLTLILRQKGYETATAATGQEALEQAREQAFNLAFLDIRLPDMAGLDLITPLQELQPHVAVIMITGHASVGTAVQAMNAGAAGYVTKPVNLDELLARAREALEKQRLGEEKRQAEAALRQSEERFRQFFEGMPEYGYLISPQGLILDVNHAACRALGYGKEELVGQSPQTIYAPESLPQMEQLLDRWGETGQIRDEELVILTRAGERRTVLLSADAVRGRAGQILHSVSVQRDITARKRAEEGLQRRTEELELLYEAGQQLSQTLDPNSIYAQLHESLSHIMDCDVLVLSSFDPEDQLIRCAFAAIEGEQQDVSGYPPVLLNSAGRGTQSVAIRTGEPLLLPDYQAWVKTSNKTYYIDKGGGVVDHQETPADANVTRSALIVPLKLQGQVVGVIQVMSYRLDAYTESNLRITEALASQIAVATNNALLYQRAQNEIAERARAEERIRRLLEQQLTVNELALALGKSRDLDRIYRIIYDHVLALMDATMFIISFYDCATQLVHAGYVASGEKELDVAAFPPIPLEEVGHGTQSQVIRTGQPWHVRDYRQAMSETETEYTITDDRKVAAGAPPANKREDSTNSALYVPMKIEGQTIGVMQVQSHQLDAYAQEDQDLLAGLANVAAIAIQNARLYDDAQRRNRELTLLNEVAREIATELDLDRLLDRAVRLVRDRFGYHHVAIFTVDREHGAVLMCARAGDLAALYPAQHRLAIDQGLVGWVAGHGETLLANDVHAEPRYVNLYPDLIPTRAELGVPIRLRGETMGVLDLQSPEVNAFAASEVAVMETVADQIAVALHNARLFAETAQLQAFHESIVQNMGDGIVVGDEDGVIDFVNPAAARMLGYGAVDLIGQPWTDLTPPDQPALIQAAQERGPVDQRELELAHQDGRRLAVLASVSPRFENDQWTGTLLVFSDISERQQAAAALEQGVARLRTTLDGIVNALASAVGARDPYTATHQRRVAQLARAIAAAMGLAEERLAGIRVAGLLHDLGKIHVPAEILSKPGRITDLEYRLIQTHVQAGYEILKTIEFPWPVAQIVLQHHERLDGSGYPAGLAGDSIILEARILGVADVVEAMASHRPYRAARGIGPALEEVSQQQGQLYDREVVMACLNLFYQQGFEFE